MSEAARRVSRLFLDADLSGDRAGLGEHEAHYLGRVLRLKRGESVLAFNGRGQEYLARIGLLTRHGGELDLLERREPLPEPDLDLVLVQALLKSEAMDFVIQKATELGARAVCPIETAFGVVRLDAGRAARRLEHWMLKARSACEQCGRHRPPQIKPPTTLTHCLADLEPTHLKLLLDPHTSSPPRPLPASTAGVCLAAGPEGGWTSRELALMQRAGFVPFSLGPRTLRAETAALTACALAQARWGDLR